jgi:HAD superfamily hydrolase (TIGR01549 family)
MSKLFIFDIDNTLVASYGIYDEAYRLTSGELLGKEFVMTRHVDGTPDAGFSKLSNPQILAQKVQELGFPEDAVEPAAFFRRFDENAKVAAETGEFILFPGVDEFLCQAKEQGKLVLLTSGSRQLQLTVLRRAGLIGHFEVGSSFFLGDYRSKREAIEEASRKLPMPDEVLHFGDAPGDMRALQEAYIDSPKRAVGVTVAGLSTEEELVSAGADAVITSYGDAFSW